MAKAGVALRTSRTDAKRCSAMRGKGCINHSAHGVSLLCGV